MNQHNASVILYSLYYVTSCDKTLPLTLYANICRIHLSPGLMLISLKKTLIKNTVGLVTNKIRYVILCFKTPYSSGIV